MSQRTRQGITDGLRAARERRPGETVGHYADPALASCPDYATGFRAGFASGVFDITGRTGTIKKARKSCSQDRRPRYTVVINRETV